MVSSKHTTANLLQMREAGRVIDAYALHLAAFSEQHPILCCCDIVAVNGTVIFPKHSRLDASIAAHLHSIVAQPLDLCVSHSKQLTIDELHADLIAILAADDFVARVFAAYRPVTILVEQLAGLNLSERLLQQIMLLKFCMPELYARSLHVAILVLLIGFEMRLGKADLQPLFLAALVHDVGMLHVAPEVLSKTEQLTVAEWETIQSHVTIGCGQLERLGSIATVVVEAVYEHHERCDGTGYPQGKVESELSLHGQLLALADSVVAIYFNNFKFNQHSWLDVFPVIGLNAQSYFMRSLEVLNNLVQRAEMPLKNVIQENPVPEFAQKILLQNIHMKQWFDVLRASLTSIGYRHGDKRLHGLQNIMLHIITTANGAQLFDDGFQLELQRLIDDPIAQTSDALEAAAMLQHELSYQLRRLSHMLDAYLGQGGAAAAEIQQTLQQCHSAIGRFLTHQV
jgi:hypothetical protein